MRFNKLFILMTLALVISLSACGARKSQQSSLNDIDVTYTISPAPATTGPAELTITLKDKKGTPINGATVRVKGDMTHAGMQPVLGDAVGDGQGNYATPFEWSMGGDWILTVDITLADGQTGSRTFNLSVSGKMQMDDGGRMNMEGTENDGSMKMDESMPMATATP